MTVTVPVLPAVIVLRDGDLDAEVGTCAAAGAPARPVTQTLPPPEVISPQRCSRARQCRCRPSLAPPVPLTVTVPVPPAVIVPRFDHDARVAAAGGAAAALAGDPTLPPLEVRVELPPTTGRREGRYPCAAGTVDGDRAGAAGRDSLPRSISTPPGWSRWRRCRHPGR